MISLVIFQKSHDCANNSANSSKASWSSVVNPLSSAQSISIIATTFYRVSTSTLGDWEATTYLSTLYDGNNNFTPTRPITRNMSWELLHIFNQLCLCFFCRSPTYTATKVNNLTCYLSLKRAQQKLWRICRRCKVEARPIDRWGRRGQRVICVPE